MSSYKHVCVEQCSVQTVQMISVKYVRINIRAEISAGGHASTDIIINKLACFTCKGEFDPLLSSVHVIKFRFKRLHV